MGSIDTAKELYESIYSLEGEWLGPSFVRPKVSEQSRAKELQDRLWDVLAECQSITNRCIRVPSPWHAALSLSHIQNKFLSEKSHVLFRGQAVARWDLATTLERSADKIAADRAVQAFCALLTDVWSGADHDVSTPYAVHIATAQHYGLSTRLLDFTPDPAVAVYFAHDRRHIGEMARVFVLSLPAANKYSARIIFPPPFVERLYIQRGIFLHLEAVAPSTIRQECTEVEFPIDPSFPPFTVIRNGCHVEMLPEDPWLKKAVDWARRWAKGQQRDFPINQSEVTKIIGAAELELGFPDAIRRGGCEIQLASWVDYFSDMLYWLAIFVEEEGEYIDRDVLKDIARNNPSLVKFAANIYDTLGKKERNIDRKIACNHFKLANLLHQSLTESLNQI